jgi:hypothetical protein
VVVKPRERHLRVRKQQQMLHRGHPSHGHSSTGFGNKNVALISLRGESLIEGWSRYLDVLSEIRSRNVGPGRFWGSHREAKDHGWEVTEHIVNDNPHVTFGVFVINLPSPRPEYAGLILSLVSQGLGKEWNAAGVCSSLNSS